MSAALSATTFTERYTAVLPLIKEEWPEVSDDDLSTAGNDLDQLVTTIAKATDGTKVKVKRHLAELVDVAKDEPAAEPKRSVKDEVATQLKGLLDKVESRSEEALNYARQEALPQAEQKMKDNLLVTVLVALGFGFLMGLLIRGSRS